MAKERGIYIDSSESVSPKIDIMERQRFIIDQVLQFYIEQGYQIVASGSLLPEEDKSVIFTGATITPLKRHLKEGMPLLVFVWCKNVFAQNAWMK